MPNPQVLDGMRAPRSVRLPEMQANAAASEAERAAPSVPLAPAGITVYVSKYRRYRVQVTAPQSYVGPDGRKNSGGKMIVAQFEDGVFRNDDHDPKVRALIDETLQANKYFGAFGSRADFWLATDQRERTEAARLKSALDTLRALPKEALDQFVGALKQGDAADHAIPAPEPTKGSVRPIPPL